MTWKSYVLVSGGTVLATYLASSPPGIIPDRQSSTPQSASAPVASRPAVDIEQEAARLQARMRAETAYREPMRNPFRFGEKPIVPRRRETTPRLEPDPVAAPTAPAAPEPPLIILSGIASDVIDGVTERTAILTTADGVLLVRAGDTVTAEYRVRAVGDDGVDLEVIADGSIRRLQFATPNPQDPTPGPQ